MTGRKIPKELSDELKRRKKPKWRFESLYSDRNPHAGFAIGCSDAWWYRHKDGSISVYMESAGTREVLACRIIVPKRHRREGEKG